MAFGNNNNTQLMEALKQLNNCGEIGSLTETTTTTVFLISTIGQKTKKASRVKSQTRHSSLDLFGSY